MSPLVTVYLLAALGAPGAYDGWWVAAAPAVAACPALSLRLFVEEGEISGTMTSGRSSTAVQGTLADDGTAILTAIGFFGQLQFGEEGAAVAFRDACGQRSAVGGRVEAE